MRSWAFPGTTEVDYTVAWAFPGTTKMDNKADINLGVNKKKNTTYLHDKFCFLFIG